MNHMKHLVAMSVALVLTLVVLHPALAEEEKPSADLSVAVLSDYIWRGQELSKDSIVIQPSMTVGYKGFSVNMWGNLDTDPYTATGEATKSNWNETDFTLSYGKEFGMVSAEVGWIYYGLDGVDDTQELYLSLGVDTLLAPTLTIYRDIASAPHSYFLLGVSHGIELTEMISLELAGSISYLSSDDVDEYPETVVTGGQLAASSTEKFDNFHDGSLSVSLPISVAKYVTVTPSLSYVFPLSSDAEDDMKRRSLSNDDNFFYGGVTVSLAF